MTVRRMRVLAGCVLMLAIGGAARGQTVEYAEVDGWPDPATSAAGTPAAWNFGQVSGVATTANGYILVLHRGAEPVMLFDSGGRFVRAWGDGLFDNGKVAGIAPADRQPGQSGYTAVYGAAGCHNCGAHAVRVDPDGNIWVVDAPGHVVYKMDFQGRVLLELGARGVAGRSRNTFDLPTDVAFGSDGAIYVSDGYGNARVVKYSADGQYLLEWGGRGTGPGEFGLPHNLAVDAERPGLRHRSRQPARAGLRRRRRVPGRVARDRRQLGPVHDRRPGHLWTGGTLRDLAGEAVATLPGGNGGHGMTVTRDGEVFVALLGGRVQKFVGAADD